MQRSMQATIEAKQDPRLVEGVDAACHDISQNRQIDHSNATGHQLPFVYCTVIHRLPLGATCSGGPPGRNTFFEGVRGRTTAEALDLAALRFAAIRQRCLQL
ncbi:hypothetical protein J3E69DRAFT_348411 [Trichoderma sp. SZMC 28015]